MLSSSLVTGFFTRGRSQEFPEEAYEGGSQIQASLWHRSVTGTCLAQDALQSSNLRPSCSDEVTGCPQRTHAHTRVFFSGDLQPFHAAGAKEERDGWRPDTGSLPTLSGACQHHRLCRWTPARKLCPQTSGQAGRWLPSSVARDVAGDTGTSPDMFLENLLQACDPAAPPQPTASWAD